MQQALLDADLEVGQISYLNLHGTATEKNDEMESMAVNRALGAGVPCSSTKSLIGHTLGAAGASEVALCWLLLSQEKDKTCLPAQVSDGCFDPLLEDIQLLSTDQTITATGPRRMMSNSFAFGGSNACVVIGEC